jgi:hypothetical protein
VVRVIVTMRGSLTRPGDLHMSFEDLNNAREPEG